MIISIRVEAKRPTVAALAFQMKDAGLLVLHPPAKGRRIEDAPEFKDFLIQASQPGGVGFFLCPLGRDRVPTPETEQCDRYADVVLRAEVLKVQE